MPLTYNIVFLWARARKSTRARCKSKAISRVISNRYYKVARSVASIINYKLAGFYCLLRFSIHLMRSLTFNRTGALHPPSRMLKAKMNLLWCRHHHPSTNRATQDNRRGIHCYTLSTYMQVEQQKQFAPKIKDAFGMMFFF